MYPSRKVEPGRWVNPRRLSRPARPPVPAKRVFSPWRSPPKLPVPYKPFIWPNQPAFGKIPMPMPSLPVPKFIPAFGPALRFVPLLGYLYLGWELWKLIHWWTNSRPPYEQFPGAGKFCDLGPPYDAGVVFSYNITAVTDPAYCGLGGQLPGSLDIKAGQRIRAILRGRETVPPPYPRFAVRMHVEWYGANNGPISVRHPAIKATPDTPWPSMDPFNLPIMNPVPQPWPIPWPVVPYYRSPHPAAVPSESPSRGSNPRIDLRPSRMSPSGDMKRSWDEDGNPSVITDGLPRTAPRPSPRPNPATNPQPAPRPNPAPLPAAPKHFYRTPRRRERERKTLIYGPGMRRIIRILNELTEGLDIIDAAYEALPWQLTKFRMTHKDRKDQLRNWGDRDITPQQKLKRIWDHWDKLDLEKFILNLAENHAEDYLYGRASRTINSLPTPRPIEWGPGI